MLDIGVVSRAQEEFGHATLLYSGQLGTALFLQLKTGVILCGRHHEPTGGLGAAAPPARAPSARSRSGSETPALRERNAAAGQSLGPAARGAVPPGDLAGRNPGCDAFALLGPARADGAPLAIRRRTRQSRLAAGGMAGGRARTHQVF